MINFRKQITQIIFVLALYLSANNLQARKNIDHSNNESSVEAVNENNQPSIVSQSSSEPNFDQDPQPPVHTHTLTENPDVEQQIQGQYPALNRPESQPLGAIQHAWDNAGEHAGTYQAIWSPHKVIRVRTREFMTSSIVLPQWEVIDEIIVGDDSAYTVSKIKSHIVLVRPKEFIGLDSTITVIGKSGRIYNFYIRTEGYNSQHIADIAVYVKAPKGSLTSLGPLTTENAPLFHHAQDQSLSDTLDDVYHDPSQIHFNFNMAGDPEIAPMRIYSDGIRTWFDYGSKLISTNLPTIYRVEDGVDTPINVTRQGNKLIAQTAGHFTLRNGEKVVCVWPIKAKI